jgi:hypothetical protein
VLPLAAKQIDFAIFGNTPIVAGLSRKLPIQILGSPEIVATSERLVAKPGIAALKDLEGKRIAVAPSSTMAFALEALIRINKLDANKIKRLPLSQPDTIAAAFPNRPTSARTAASGLRMRSSLGRTRSMSSIRIGRGAKDVACVRLLQLGPNRTGADGYHLVLPAILPCATTSNTTMLDDMDAVAAELERAPMTVLDNFQLQFACISICRLTRPRFIRGEACASCRPARDRTRACASLKATGRIHDRPARWGLCLRVQAGGRSVRPGVRAILREHLVVAGLAKVDPSSIDARGAEEHDEGRK